MTKARILADFISDGSPLADGTISVAEVSGAAPLASPTFTGTASGTFSGPLTGAVTGNVTGAVTGNVTGNLTGDVLGDLDLTAISATIADTAVDIFVYDTSKDSDGGAWRKRTQGTSWYNETLGTGTRGSRKEFPSVAVIVAEATQITIYDGDDPALPMWMVFNTGGTAHGSDNVIGASGDTMSSISMLSGIMMIGTNAARLINFVSEVAYRYSTSGAKPYNGTIAERNSGKGTGTVIASLAIVNNTVNDVAMTVLPNAPIDAATGLPVPTIAVATDGGVSVIKDDGTVVDLTNSGYESNFVNFQDEQIVLNLYQTSSNNNWWAISYHDIPSSDITGLSSTTRFNGSTDDFPSILGPLTLNPSAISKDSLGNSSGLTNIYRYLPDYDKSMVAYTTSDYATGWMNGDIKLATLSDTDDTNVTGAELVTNGTFDSDTTGWTAGSSTLSVVSNKLRVTNSGVVNGYGYQAITTVVGTKYVCSFDTTVGTATTANLWVGTSAGSYNVAASGGLTSTGAYAVTFTATSTTTYLNFINGSVSNGYNDYDNITMRLAEEDRSVNGNGLQVFGTITKNPVATGADLVSYGGLTNDNYLQQPYNSDLNFGTGDFCVMGWVNVGSNTSHQGLLNRDTLGATGAGLLIEYRFDLAAILFQPRDGSTVANSFTTTGSIGLNRWIFFVGVRDNSGTVQRLYVNGELNQTVSVSALNVDSTTAITRLGREVNQGRNFSGKMALWRISGTVPSQEQIKKIYEDEKVLFQENAQATLYGSSDAVTALAYDDTTELLHVGTSQGRSVFQGLRRVNNTTNAVGAAISASNGMIVEE